jgi:dipeptidyl aminopeptidase/acylaminoacyl peptidase
MGDEPAVAAAWADSVYADLTETLRHQLSRQLIPFFFADVVLEISRWRGEEIASPSPLDSVRALNGRRLAIVAGETDSWVPVEQARKVAQAAEAAGGQPEVWILPGVGHAGAMSAEPAEYERRLVGFFDAALLGPASP